MGFSTIGDYSEPAGGGGGALDGVDDQSSSNDDQVTIKDGEVVINEDSDDMDFRVESNGNANMLFVGGGEDGVGLGTSDIKSALTIGTAAPVVTVDTDDASDNKSLTLCGGGAGSITRGPYVFLGGNEHGTAANKGTIKLACGVGDGGSNVGDLYVYQGTGANNRMLIDQGETVFNEDSIDADFRVESNGSANMLFVDGGNNRVGVNSGSPTEALDVDGAVALKSQSSAPSATADYGKFYALGNGPAADSDIKLLLHGQGSDGASTITDSSQGSHSPSANTAVTTDTAQNTLSQSSSILFNGSSSVLTYADHTDWDIGTGTAFVIHTFVRWDGTPSTGVILSSGDNNGFRFRYDSTSGGIWKLAYGTGFASGYNVADTGLSADTWHHVAVVRQTDGTTRIFRDGVQKGADGSVTGALNVNGLVVGRSYDAYWYMDGWMQELTFMTNSNNGWSGTSITVPTAPVGASSEMYVRDGAGNETKLSSHTPGGEWEYYSKSPSGEITRINMEEVVRDLGQLTGKDYIKSE